jgi:hypothetical protein
MKRLTGLFLFCILSPAFAAAVADANYNAPVTSTTTSISSTTSIDAPALHAPPSTNTSHNKALNGTPQQAITKSREDPAAQESWRGVYLRGVPSSTTEEDLRSIFSCCGTINNIRISQSKLYTTNAAYVDFDSWEGTAEALRRFGAVEGAGAKAHGSGAAASDSGRKAGKGAAQDMVQMQSLKSGAGKGGLTAGSDCGKIGAGNGSNINRKSKAAVTGAAQMFPKSGGKGAAAGGKGKQKGVKYHRHQLPEHQKDGLLPRLVIKGVGVPVLPKVPRAVRAGVISKAAVPPAVSVQVHFSGLKAAAAPATSVGELHPIRCC